MHCVWYRCGQHMVAIQVQEIEVLSTPAPAPAPEAVDVPLVPDASDDTHTPIRKVVADGTTPDEPFEPKIRLIEVVNVDINQISSVDLLNQTFVARVYIEVRFPYGCDDPDLCVRSNEFPFGPDGKPTFRPAAAWYMGQIDFNNASKKKILDCNVYPSPPHLIGAIYFDAVFTECYELHDFPFDVQPLTMSLAINCRVSGKTPARFVVAEDATMGSCDNFHLGDVYNLRPRVYVACGETGQGNRVFPSANVVVIIERHPQYFITNVFVPMFLFVTIACMNNIIPLTEIAERLNFTLAMILTLIAFKFSINAMLPQVAYTTLLDHYLMTGFFITCILVFEDAAMWHILRDHAKIIISPLDDRLVDADSNEWPRMTTWADLRNLQINSTNGEEMPVGLYSLDALFVEETNLYSLNALQHVHAVEQTFFYTNLALWGLVNLWTLFRIYRVRRRQAEKRFTPAIPTAFEEKPAAREPSTRKRRPMGMPSFGQSPMSSARSSFASRMATSPIQPMIRGFAVFNTKGKQDGKGSAKEPVNMAEFSINSHHPREKLYPGGLSSPVRPTKSPTSSLKNVFAALTEVPAAAAAVATSTGKKRNNSVTSGDSAS